MNYASIKSCDIANGPGVRVSLFVSGCTHHCKDCFNEEAWDKASISFRRAARSMKSPFACLSPRMMLSNTVIASTSMKC